MSFAEVAAPAIRIAREGFPVYPHMANFIRDNEKCKRRSKNPSLKRPDCSVAPE
jgi:gamma-glutamyltranspeptidase